MAPGAPSDSPAHQSRPVRLRCRNPSGGDRLPGAARSEGDAVRSSRFNVALAREALAARSESA
ncbi:hypothetical protein GS498_18490, partial [Rhodococcus hoagii]|nr:hypothetical protein [Prescottella equi]